jgi:hypothetical protein
MDDPLFDDISSFLRRMKMPEGKTQVCNWNEELGKFVLIWIPDVDAHFADERYQDDYLPSPDGTCDRTE